MSADSRSVLAATRASSWAAGWGTNVVVVWERALDRPLPLRGLSVLLVRGRRVGSGRGSELDR